MDTARKTPFSSNEEKKIGFSEGGKMDPYRDSTEKQSIPSTTQKNVFGPPREKVSIPLSI